MWPCNPPLQEKWHKTADFLLWFILSHVPERFWNLLRVQALFGSSKQLQIMQPCVPRVMTFCSLFEALFDLSVASGKGSDQHVLECCTCLLVHPGMPASVGGSAACWMQGPLQGTCADTSEFLETDMAEAKAPVPAASLPAQLFLATWWLVYFICFSADLLIKSWNFEEIEFLPKCIRVLMRCRALLSLRWKSLVEFSNFL